MLHHFSVTLSFCDAFACIVGRKRAIRVPFLVRINRLRVLNNESRKKTMKHVLLATTALSLSAGFAAAEVSVSFSGKANAGISSTTTTTAAVEAAAASADLAGIDAAGAYTQVEANIVTILSGTATVDAADAFDTTNSVASSGIDLNFS